MKSNESRLITRRSFVQKSALSLATITLSTTFFQVNDLFGSEKINVPEMNPYLIKKALNPEKMTEFERLHVPILKMPIIAEDGSTVPFYIESNHPMDPDHYIKSVEIINFKDPIAHKGRFVFTPAVGRIYVSAQIRMVSGTSNIMAIAECTKDGRWVTSTEVKVTVGGC